MYFLFWSLAWEIKLGCANHDVRVWKMLLENWKKGFQNRPFLFFFSCLFLNHRLFVPLNPSFLLLLLLHLLRLFPSFVLFHPFLPSRQSSIYRLASLPLTHNKEKEENKEGKKGPITTIIGYNICSYRTSFFISSKKLWRRSSKNRLRASRR